MNASTTAEPAASAPFAGIKVLAVARVVAAPFSTYQLALHGADVISVENADGRGDQARRTGNPASKEYFKHLMAPHFMSHGSNKRSMTLNLGTPGGREIFLRLAKDADVIVENFRSGSMDKRGLGYRDISAINPRIIYASLTGYGQSGPKRFDAAIDPAIQAGSGIMSITGSPQSGPLKVGAPITDYFAGMGMAFAIATALYHRVTTGRGQYIDTSLLEAALVMISNVVGETLATGIDPKLVGNRSPFKAPTTDCYPCREGHLYLAASQDAQRERLWKVLERPDVAADPRFQTRESCQEHIEALHAEIGRTLMTRTAGEWEDLISQAGLPVMKVRTITEIADHPQIVERGLFQKLENVRGTGLSTRVPKAFFKMSAWPARITSEPPRLGEHTDEILEAAGYGADEIARFRAAGDI